MTDKVLPFTGEWEGEVRDDLLNLSYFQKVVESQMTSPTGKVETDILLKLLREYVKYVSDYIARGEIRTTTPEAEDTLLTFLGMVNRAAHSDGDELC